MTIIKAAAVQVSPVLYSREATTEKIVQKTAELGREGVQFATFPEPFCPIIPISRSCCVHLKRSVRTSYCSSSL